MKSILKSLYFKLNPSSTEVIITPGGARWGNLLYFFLRAFIYKENGKSLKILRTNHMEELLLLFPSLQQFIIEEKSVKAYHKKDNSNNFYQVFGEDFNKLNLDNFIKEHLLVSEFAKAYLHKIKEPDVNDLTINIRRGDFYTKGNYSIYGYDQIGFIKHVFDHYIKEKKWKTINILSDDMDWCKENFIFLQEHCQYLNFPHLTDNQTISSFLWVAKSKNLILSNSTFSFWAAYISNYLYASQETTYCPIFGSRRIENTDLYQFNPKWTMIRDFKF